MRELISMSTTHNKRLLRMCLMDFVGENKMNFIIWLIVGGLVGWVASIIMKANVRPLKWNFARPYPVTADRKTVVTVTLAATMRELRMFRR